MMHSINIFVSTLRNIIHRKIILFIFISENIVLTILFVKMRLKYYI